MKEVIIWNKVNGESALGSFYEEGRRDWSGNLDEADWLLSYIAERWTRVKELNYTKIRTWFHVEYGRINYRLCKLIKWKKVEKNRSIMHITEQL
jgi:hypothetical protein